jgi:hypothetical protein
MCAVLGRFKDFKMKKLLFILFFPLFCSAQKPILDQNNHAIMLADGTLLAIAETIVPFKPTDYSGCQWWLYGDSARKDGSNKVYNWPDQSGNGNDATLTGTTYINKPLYVTNQLNGHSIIRWNKSQLVLNSAITLTNSNYTIFCVTKLTATNLVLPYLLAIANGGAGTICTGDAYLGWGTFINGGGQFGTIANIVNTWEITSFEAPGAPKRILKNNVEYAYNNNGNITTPNVIGCISSNAGWAQVFYGDCAEIIIYNVRLTSTQVTTVLSYLNTKYAIY